MIGISNKAEDNVHVYRCIYNIGYCDAIDSASRYSLIHLHLNSALEEIFLTACLFCILRSNINNSMGCVQLLQAMLWDFMHACKVVMFAFLPPRFRKTLRPCFLTLKKIETGALIQTGAHVLPYFGSELLLAIICIY